MSDSISFESPVDRLESLRLEDAAGVILLVAKFRDEGNIETALTHCTRCGKEGEIYPCRDAVVSEHGPEGWRADFICRDCAERSMEWVYEYPRTALYEIFGIGQPSPDSYTEYGYGNDPPDETHA